VQRRIEYTWRLRELMAAGGMHNISDLIPQLKDRGIELSASQIYRLVGAKPERMNIALLGALLDVLDCTFEELCPVAVVATPARLAANGTNGGSSDRKDAMRPRRARIHRPE